MLNHPKIIVLFLVIGAFLGVLILNETAPEEPKQTIMEKVTSTLSTVAKNLKEEGQKHKQQLQSDTKDSPQEPGAHGETEQPHSTKPKLKKPETAPI